MVNIVLYQPEICQNTANIIRTCLAVGAKLHIIKPTSFDLHPHWMKRSAAGRYLSDIEHEIHASYQDFLSLYGNSNSFFLTRYSKEVYSDVDYARYLREEGDIYLIFGRESTGIDIDILRANRERCLRIPMSPASRSLNLANSVAIVCYEVMRQLGYPDLSTVEIQKGEDYLWTES